MMIGSPLSPPAGSGTVGIRPHSARSALPLNLPSAATIKVDVFDEQARRRRQTWRMSLACFVITLALGMAMSTLLGPILLAITGSALKLVAWLGCGDACRAFARSIGDFARQDLLLLAEMFGSHPRAQTTALALVATRLPAIAAVFLPSMIAAACAWLVIRRGLSRAGMLDLVAAMGARAPRSTDASERQLVNAVEEMALAAGLGVPRIMIVDSPVVNAVTAGPSHEASVVVVTRGLLDQLNRDQVQAVMAHCIGSIGNGDLGVMQSLLATLQTLALFHTILDFPFRRPARQALSAYAKAILAPRTSPEKVWEASQGIEAIFDGDADEEPTLLTIPLMPIRALILLQRIVLVIWSGMVLGWPLALLWRARRYLADSSAVQLTRNPDALASSLPQFAAHAGVPEGGESRDYLFVHGAQRESSVFERSGTFISMHPPLERRLRRLSAMGATLAGDSPPRRWPLPSILIAAILGIIVAPLLLLGALLLLTVIEWSMIMAVFFSLTLGLMFVAWAFG
jgi:Zn-dependent protease with chaperone function